MFGNVARSRLLPMSLPFRYFGAAVVFQVAAWALLAFSSGDLTRFRGGLGPVFAALHLVTLGVLAMAAIGATLQLLPVATRQPVRSLAAARLAWWLYTPGVALFTAAAAWYAARAMAAGALLLAAGLAVYALLLGRNLYGARGMRVVVSHGWVALASLLAAAATGVALVARYEHGLALDHAAFRTAHAAFAAYGFMGLLALGLSSFLLPMLALSPPPGQRLSYAVLAAAAAAIALAATGYVLAGALIGLAAAAAHVLSLERSLRARLRRPLGPSFVLVRVSWGCLLAGLGVAVLMALDIAPENAAAAFWLLLVPGWLLTFLLGVLERILPFLGSVHASTTAHGTPLITSLTPSALLWAHCALHVAAILALLAAAAMQSPALAQAGAAAGLCAAALYAVFFFFVVIKVRQHGTQLPHQPAPA